MLMFTKTISLITYGIGNAASSNIGNGNGNENGTGSKNNNEATDNTSVKIE